MVLSAAISPAQSDSTTNPAINKVLSIVKTVEDGNNFIDQLSPDSNAALPFGIIKQIGQARYIVAIDSMKFRPNGAFFSAYAAIDFPGTTKKIAFEATNIKFTPKGVVGGSQARLMLVSEHTIKINNMVSLNIKPDGNNFVDWDCNGFKGISLKGTFVFSKTKLSLILLPIFKNNMVVRIKDNTITKKPMVNYFIFFILSIYSKTQIT